MGQDICNGCIYNRKEKEENINYKNESNLIESDYNNNDVNEQQNIENKNTINKTSTLIKSIPQKKTNNNYINDSIGVKNTNYQEENEYKELNEELNIIKYNYKLRLLYNLFIKLKNEKNISHKKIFIEQNYKEKLKSKNINKYNSNKNNNYEINLYPIETYDYIGNKFKHFKDGFGIQKFYNKEKNINSSYIGRFRNDYRIGYCKYIDNNNDYTYKGDTNFNETGKYGIYTKYIMYVYT